MESARPTLFSSQAHALGIAALALTAPFLPLPVDAEAQSGEEVMISRNSQSLEEVDRNLSTLRLRGPARPGKYLGAVGPESAWLGFETGEGEVWTHPMKVLRDLRLSFLVPSYAEPIPGRGIASHVSAAPGHATVVSVSYTHLTLPTN